MAIQYLLSARMRAPNGILTGNATFTRLAVFFQRYLYDPRIEISHVEKRYNVFAIDFAFNFNCIDSIDFLAHFRFTRKNIFRLILFFARPET